jgi:tetratricopeptide (TPR) repeat protein
MLKPLPTRHNKKDCLSHAALCGLLILAMGCGGEQQVSNANQLFIEASKLIGEGQKDAALEKLNASIAVEPSLWSYRERAKLLTEQGKDEAALKDCDAALALVPDDPDMLWLKGEIAKPAAQRFQGKFKSPPSSSR